MQLKPLGITVGGAAALGAGALAAYLFAFRPWRLRWGATDEEVGRAMPLDEEVKEPTYVTNRAVTIDARPGEVWPWLAQMGELPRGGFHSYVWVERLQGMKVRNARRVLPEFQNIKIGDVIDRRGNMAVKAVEPGSVLVLGPPAGRDVEATWALCLYPAGENRTRLVSRVRARVRPTPKGLLLLLVLDPGQFVMERKMLLVVKRLAEGLAKRRAERERSLVVENHSGW